MQSSTVYVGNLDNRVDKALIYELFVQIGPVTHIKLPKETTDDDHLKYAFVKFSNTEDTEYACKLFDGKVSLFGKTLKVRKSNQRNEVAAFDVGAKLFIKNVDESIDVPQLSNIFKKFGNLLQKPVIFYLQNGTLRCAYVWFTTFKDSDEALSQMNDTLLVNKIIHMDYAYKDDKERTSKHGDKIERLLDEERQRNVHY